MLFGMVWCGVVWCGNGGGDADGDGNSGYSGDKGLFDWWVATGLENWKNIFIAKITKKTFSFLFVCFFYFFYKSSVSLRWKKKLEKKKPRNGKKWKNKKKWKKNMKGWDWKSCTWTGYSICLYPEWYHIYLILYRVFLIVFFKKIFFLFK